MDPSSLIFVVIVAIWAAYLLGHWVRRRDQVATVRSVDRFSEAMRVLERRPAVRSVPLSRPNPRSYVVAPARPAAPQVSVKRAPAVTARPAVGAPQARPVRTAAPRGNIVRAVVLLGLVVLTPVTWLLAALTSAVAWWIAGLVTLALVGVVAELRQRARRARELARRRQRLEQRTRSQVRRQSRRQVVGEVVAAHRERGGAPATLQPDAADAAPAPAAPAEGTDGGWQPVPVPPPTYTLKPKAPPRVRPAMPAQARPHAEEPVAAVASPAPVAAPASPAPAFDLDEILERRIASGG